MGNCVDFSHRTRTHYLICNEQLEWIGTKELTKVEANQRNITTSPLNVFVSDSSGDVDLPYDGAVIEISSLSRDLVDYVLAGMIAEPTEPSGLAHLSWPNDICDSFYL